MAIAESRTIPFVGPEHIDASVLETFGYDGPEQEIVTETAEFSAVCPYSGLPDFATLTRWLARSPLASSKPARVPSTAIPATNTAFQVCHQRYA